MPQHGLHFSHITKCCFINAPFNQLREELLELFLTHRIQPEIGLEGFPLDSYNTNDFETIAQTLRSAGLSCTLHAPFLGLDPGATNRLVREHTWGTLRKAFDLISIFKPVSIVCHLNHADGMPKDTEEKWYAYSITIWKELLARAEQHETILMFENTYETSATAHKHLLQSLASPYARFCLDVGHVTAFAKNRWQNWLPDMTPWLGQLHLHDNHGDHDDHLAIGAGKFDFTGLFDYLKTHKLSPIITLEPHHENGLWESLEAINHMDLF